MSFQLAIVLAIIAAAVAFAGVSIWRKRKAFTVDKNCGSDDCGCGK